MNVQNNPSLSRVLGPVKVSNIKAAKRNKDVTVKNGIRRSIVVDTENHIDKLDPEVSFELVLSVIAKKIDQDRGLIERALIDTGSLPLVAKMGRKEFNSEVQNRLVQNDSNGDRFRDYMTKIVTNQPIQKNESGFFFDPKESKLGVNGLFEAFQTANQSNNSSSMTMPMRDPFPSINTTLAPTSTPNYANLSSGSNVAAPAENRRGEKDNTKGSNPQDWGNILSGGASVISSVGGIIGLFKGGNTAQGGSVLDPYSQDDYINATQNNAANKSGKTIFIVGAVVVVIGIIVTIIVLKRQKKNN